jgi:GNAT superfamily N-acetyltransferase
MRDLTIRPARPEDLTSLIRRLGQGRFFADRLARQRDERGVLLTAWHGGTVIGDVYLWLEPAEEPEIRTFLPGVPLVTHLEIHRDHRCLGAGTRLIRAAEQWLTRLGHAEVALAVEVNNRAAARLYTRLGYREWPHPPVTCYSPGDLNGHRRVELCFVMVKKLSG